MPERKPSCAPGEGSAVLSDTSAPGVKVLPAAYPLDEFYLRAGVTLPDIAIVAAAELPQPYRSLLAHNNDMTPTLSAFHASVIHLRVLSREHRGDFYFREVVLLAEDREAPVEFGAIRINLALFAPSARGQILDERVPLGNLLRLQSVVHSSRPKAFFRVRSDALIAQALGLSQPETLYGRRNTLLDAVNRPLAEVVEILPPLREPAAGYVSPPNEL